MSTGTDWEAKDDVNKSVQGKDKSAKNEGLCADEDGKIDMKGMFWTVKGTEEVEEEWEGRRDDEVTVVEVRSGNGTVEGGS